MDASEREILTDLIGAVRTLAAQTPTLHLQLGAVRTIPGRNGTISEAEFTVTLTKLEAVSSADELLFPSLSAASSVAFNQSAEFLTGTGRFTPRTLASPRAARRRRRRE
jgi:hypothetical protein